MDARLASSLWRMEESGRRPRNHDRPGLRPRHRGRSGLRPRAVAALRLPRMPVRRRPPCIFFAPLSAISNWLEEEDDQKKKKISCGPVRYIQRVFSFTG